MPTDVEITDPSLSVFVPVPPASTDGTCMYCHGAAGRRTDNPELFYMRCWSCKTNIPTNGIQLIVPISLVHVEESQLYASLRDYKGGPHIDADVRDLHALLLAATLQRFLRVHRAHIEEAAGKQWDTIAVVPSTRGRDGPHPLEEVIRRAPALSSELVSLLEPTGEKIDHNKTNPAAFRATREAAGRSVLLTDDTFTTGARVQSAAAALNAAGANVVAAVPIGRVINTRSADHPENKELWQSQRRLRFSFEVCCLEP